jgi:putative NADPH-quinone reductase
MIWQFPLWWFGLPAMVQGWLDRVFAMGLKRIADESPINAGVY